MALFCWQTIEAFRQRPNLKSVPNILQKMFAAAEPRRLSPLRSTPVVGGGAAAQQAKIQSPQWGLLLPLCSLLDRRLGRLGLQ
jgi:hypothetical protein